MKSLKFSNKIKEIISRIWNIKFFNKYCFANILLIIPTLLATILSQVINLMIGFYVYGKKVFKIRSLNNLVFFNIYY